MKDSGRAAAVLKICCSESNHPCLKFFIHCSDIIFSQFSWDVSYFISGSNAVPSQMNSFIVAVDCWSQTHSCLQHNIFLSVMCNQITFEWGSLQVWLKCHWDFLGKDLRKRVKRTRTGRRAVIHIISLVIVTLMESIIHYLDKVFLTNASPDTSLQ